MLARTLTQLSNMAAVLLKYFLDIDIHHFRDSFTILFLLAPFMQSAFNVLAREFRYNCLTIKEDAVIVKEEVTSLYKRLINYSERFARQLAK